MIWFTHQVILTQLPGQELHVEVFDKDMDMKDDFMGRYNNDKITQLSSSCQPIRYGCILISKNPNVQAEDQSEGHYRLSVH